MPKIPGRPVLVNRGAAGLLNKLPTKSGNGKPESTPAESQKSQVRAPEKAPAPVNRIRCPGVVVPIESLIPDPNNARLHPERNMAAIVRSFELYGQLKPIVVRKATNTVMAGNGSLEAAKRLGWTEIAVSLVDLSEAEAAGFGIADNRTAELAKWDFETMTRLDKLYANQKGYEAVGWSADELEVLRHADFTPPAVDDNASFGSGDGKGSGDEALVLSLTPDQHSIIMLVVNKARELKSDPELDIAEAVKLVCDDWLNHGDE